MSTYSEKLKDPRWQKMRLEIMQRDEFTCQMCKSTEDTLHVHHKYYLPGREPWEYSARTLITLCENCHTEEEECKHEQQEIIKALLDNGFSNKEMAYFAALLGSFISSRGKDFIDTILARCGLNDGVYNQVKKILDDDLAERKKNNSENAKIEQENFIDDIPF